MPMTLRRPLFRRVCKAESYRCRACLPPEHAYHSHEMANSDAKPHEEHITKATTIVANIVNILFVRIPPAINVSRLKKKLL
jgi:hypothetical protein